MESHGRTSPRRSRKYLRRIAALVLAALIGGFGSALAIPSAAQAAYCRPVIFVHGFKGAGLTDWSVLVDEFKQAGCQSLWKFTYDYTRSNKTIAGWFGNAVDEVRSRTGASHVDVVTHSMGGLSTRWYIKFLGGDATVDSWVSLGGPNHGTDWAYACWYAACYDMRPGSEFLSTLNAGDETPAAVAYGTWWSPCDGLIDPDESVILSGARNTKTACVGHIEMVTDRTIARQVVWFATNT